jgi:hypothetical protein
MMKCHFRYSGSWRRWLYSVPISVRTTHPDYSRSGPRAEKIARPAIENSLHVTNRNSRCAHYPRAVRVARDAPKHRVPGPRRQTPVVVRLPVATSVQIWLHPSMGDRQKVDADLSSLGYLRLPRADTVRLPVATSVQIWLHPSMGGRQKVDADLSSLGYLRLPRADTVRLPMSMSVYTGRRIVLTLIYRDPTS